MEFLVFFVSIFFISWLTTSQWLVLWGLVLAFISLNPSMSSLVFNSLSSGDGVSYLMNLFCLWSVTASFWKWGYLTKTSFLQFLMDSLLVILLMFFSVKSFLGLYVYFEASLIPIFFIILGWGYQPERLEASYYLMLYTVFGSMPLLWVILSLSESQGIFLLEELENLSNKGKMTSEIFAICGVLAFLIKLPIFLAHHWLPKAHVEAPVFGSMVLASILLKLGGYALLRYIPWFFNSFNMSLIFITLSLVGGVIISLICLRQMDMKILIAYSSVAHMALVAGGLLVGSSSGLKVALAMMLAHGFVSSGMFAGADLLYKRLNSRNLTLVKGILILLPSFSMFWFILSMGNMGTPPSMNFMSEMCGIVALMEFSFLFFVLIILLGWLAVIFTLILFTHTQHSEASKSFGLKSMELREMSIFLYHVVPMYLGMPLLAYLK